MTMNIKISKILRSIIRTDPIFITLAYVGFIWVILIVTVYFGTEGMKKSYSIVSFITTIIITGIPIAITFYHIASYKETLSSFIRLFSLMAQIILLFGTIYFVLQTMSASIDLKESNYTQISKDNFPLSNVSISWYYQVLENNPEKLETLYNALLSFQDCIHFSLVTSSTVGYGDIVPKHPITKLIVDIQIVLSFIIVAFGIGVFISLKAKKAHQGNRLPDQSEQIENNLPKASNAKLQEWNKYSEFMLQKFINLKKLIIEEQNKRK